MKKHKLLIKPRCCGKTTQILDAVTNENEMGTTNSFILVPKLHRRSYDHIARERKLRQDEIMVEDELCVQMHQKHKFSKMYIDEYFALSKDTREYLFNYMFLGPHKVTAYGTPHEQYLRQDIAEVSTWWKLQHERSEICPILKLEHEMVEKYGQGLMYSLIVHPCIEVILPFQDGMEKMLPKDKYEMEVLGKIYKDK
jgi:hypothetical protein